MFKTIKTVLACSFLLFTSLAVMEQAEAAPVKPAAESVKPVDVVMKTTKGDMVIRLNPEKAPITVKNFLSYVDKGFYKDVVFHRVMPGFMIQGGGMTADMSEKATGSPIKNESSNGLRNSRGTIAMARTPDPDSATAQFFINLVNNEFLNDRPGRPGYAVFGDVIKGDNVMDSIASVKTGRRGPHANVPVEPITILAVERVTAAPNKETKVK
ncbi:peptidylprolyl isomerase [Endozoicomonas arenosclerae]|uniref:peptidylprolyl isomerase n=1 Tax=Endozoicomonas arenosclerae TaxID=1633495 RepID=UPI000B2ACC6A|nr:peptidylprolyl isomerase [Endozoicomonas arenosclerae]